MSSWESKILNLSKSAMSKLYLEGVGPRDISWGYLGWCTENFWTLGFLCIPGPVEMFLSSYLKAWESSLLLGANVKDFTLLDKVSPSKMFLFFWTPDQRLTLSWNIVREGLSSKKRNEIYYESIFKFIKLTLLCSSNNVSKGDWFGETY